METPTGVSETTIYPVDPTTLKKGDYLTPDFCETRVKCRDRNHKKYDLQLQSLKEWIERARDFIGAPVVLRCEKGGIRVLDDTGAATYTSQQFDLALRRAGRAHRRSLHVDVGNLTPDDRRTHERSIEIHARQLQAIAVEAFKFTLPTHKRNSPGVPKLPKPPSTTLPPK
jgi:hypothetical protein